MKRWAWQFVGAAAVAALAYAARTKPPKRARRGEDGEGEDEGAEGGVVPFSQLNSITQLRNEYYFVRHGESEANVAKLITSSVDLALDKHGLTSQGKAQAVRAGVELKAIVQERRAVIVTSDYLRARETAEAINSTLNVRDDDFILSRDLRERFFGEFDGTSSDNYARVWEGDEKDGSSQPFGAESAHSVLWRSTRVVRECEQKYVGCVIVLVSHGDVGQIIQTGFTRKHIRSTCTERFSDPIENAQVRPLVLAPLCSDATTETHTTTTGT